MNKIIDSRVVVRQLIDLIRECEDVIAIEANQHNQNEDIPARHQPHLLRPATSRAKDFSDRLRSLLSVPQGQPEIISREQSEGVEHGEQVTGELVFLRHNLPFGVNPTIRLKYLRETDEHRVAVLRKSLERLTKMRELGGEDSSSTPRLKVETHELFFCELMIHRFRAGSQPLDILRALHDTGWSKKKVPSPLPNYEATKKAVDNMMNTLRKKNAPILVTAHSSNMLSWRLRQN